MDVYCEMTKTCGSNKKPKKTKKKTKSQRLWLAWSGQVPCKAVWRKRVGVTKKTKKTKKTKISETMAVQVPPSWPGPLQGCVVCDGVGVGVGVGLRLGIGVAGRDLTSHSL